MSLLKENRINNCFKYCNLFPVTVTPPEKKSTPPEEGQQEWVKVMAEKALKVQDSSILGRGNTTLWVAHVAHYEQWQITVI